MPVHSYMALFGWIFALIFCGFFQSCLHCMLLVSYLTLTLRPTLTRPSLHATPYRKHRCRSRCTFVAALSIVAQSWEARCDGVGLLLDSLEVCFLPRRSTYQQPVILCCFRLYEVKKLAWHCPIVPRVKFPSYVQNIPTSA